MYHFIINPNSCSSKSLKKWKEIKSKLTREKVNFESHITSKSRNACQIAREITAIETSKKNILVILGGDGTLNEVINGITSFENLILGYIPTGSSNDFARSLRLKTNIMDALECVLHPKKYAHLDYGVLSTKDDSKNFLVSSGIGYDAAVCEEANKSSAKNFLNVFGLGKLTYGVLGIKNVFSYQPKNATITIDNSSTFKVNNMLFTSIHNNRYEGGGFLFCPDADSSDGILDLCVTENISKLKFLVSLPFAVFGKHTIFKGVETYRCNSVEIQTDNPLPVHTDGETIDRQTKISVKCGNEKICIIIE